MVAPNEQTADSRTSHRRYGFILAMCYVTVVIAAGLFVTPLRAWMLTAIGLLPALVAFLLGMPVVIRSRLNWIVMVFYLLVFPLVAALTMGLPGVLAARGIGDVFR